MSQMVRLVEGGSNMLEVVRDGSGNRDKLEFGQASYLLLEGYKGFGALKVRGVVLVGPLAEADVRVWDDATRLQHNAVARGIACWSPTFYLRDSTSCQSDKENVAVNALQTEYPDCVAAPGEVWCMSHLRHAGDCGRGSSAERLSGTAEGSGVREIGVRSVPDAAVMQTLSPTQPWPGTPPGGQTGPVEGLLSNS